MPKKILVVDDKANIVLSLEFLMKQAGYDVRTASDGEEALAAIDADPPDLILLDVNMPTKTVLKSVRRSEPETNGRTSALSC